MIVLRSENQKYGTIQFDSSSSKFSFGWVLGCILFITPTILFSASVPKPPKLYMYSVIWILTYVLAVYLSTFKLTTHTYFHSN